MELPTGEEASVECALEACFVAGRFATVWALRLKVSDEFIAGGFHREQSTCLGNCFLSRRPLAEMILGWICHKLDIYGSIDCSLARSCCLMGRNTAWFKYLFSPSKNQEVNTSRFLVSS